MAEQPYKLDGLPSDLMSSNAFNVRRLKTESSVIANNAVTSNQNPFPVKIIDSRTGRESEIDVITFGLVTIDVAHHELHEGNHFFVKDWVDIPSASSVDLLYVSGSMEAHMRTSFEGTAAFQVDIYEGTVTSNNGTLKTVFNRKRSSTTTCGCAIYAAPTVTSAGTVFIRYKLGAGKTGGSSSAENEVILKANTKYLIRLTSNVTGTVNTIDYLADWYEHTE